MPTILVLVMSAILAACGGSPEITLSTEPWDGRPKPLGYQKILDGQVKRSLDSCYKEALASEKGLTGTVVAKIAGSHGVLHFELLDDTQPGPLATCVEQAFSDPRMQRVLLDSDNITGFRLIARFGK